MKNESLNIVLLISSQETSRIYLNVLKDYLQNELKDVKISYFISQHDSENSQKRQSAIIESSYINQENCIVIGLDGNLPAVMMNNIKAKKLLIHLSEHGVDRNKKKYLSGYDYFVAFDDCVEKYFEDICKKQNIKMLKGAKSVFSEQLNKKGNIVDAEKKLCLKYPQMEGKKIVSLITRGTCTNHLLKKYNKIDLKKMLCQLPSNVIFMTNCRQIQLLATKLPYKYSNKFVAFGQNDLLDVIYASKWIISNMAITESSRAIQVPLLYSGNEYEKKVQKVRRKQCIKPDDKFIQNIMEFIEGDKKNLPHDDNNRLAFADLMSSINFF